MLKTIDIAILFKGNDIKGLKPPSVCVTGGRLHRRHEDGSFFIVSAEDENVRFFLHRIERYGTNYDRIKDVVDGTEVAIVGEPVPGGEEGEGEEVAGGGQRGLAVYNAWQVIRS